jgi:hypothetical protein
MFGLKSISIFDRHVAKLKITVSFDGHHFTLFLTKKSSTSHASRREGRFSSIHVRRVHLTRYMLILCDTYSPARLLSDLGYQDEVISMRSRIRESFVSSFQSG